MLNFEGNRGTKKQYWGAGNYFRGTGEHANLFQGNMGTDTPMGGPHLSGH